MMEKVVLAPQRPRKTDEELKAECGAWAAQGKPAGRARNIVTSLELQSEKMEVINKRLQEKYKALEENEVRYEAIECDDADYVIVAFGSSARICSATVEMARAEGLKVGLLRPITLYPSPRSSLPRWPRGASRDSSRRNSTPGRWSRTCGWPSTARPRSSITGVRAA